MTLQVGESMTPQTLRDRLLEHADALTAAGPSYLREKAADLLREAAAALPAHCPCCQSTHRRVVLDVELDGRPGTRRPCPHPWHDAPAQAGEAPTLPERPRDRYHWGEEMPQYAALGIGPEAWADLTLEERNARDANYRDNVPVSLKWSTLRVVMAALRAIRLVDFRQAGEAADPASPAEPHKSIIGRVHDRILKLADDCAKIKSNQTLASVAREQASTRWTTYMIALEIIGQEEAREAVVRPRAESTPSTYADLPDLMQAGRWEDATRLLIAKVDALYTAAPADAPGAQDEIARLRARASKLEDAAFHFQTCATCKQHGEDTCDNGRLFASFLRGEVPA